MYITLCTSTHATQDGASIAGLSRDGPQLPAAPAPHSGHSEAARNTPAEVVAEQPRQHGVALVQQVRRGCQAGGDAIKLGPGQDKVADTGE